MPPWVVIFMVVIGGLFALKLLYVLSTGWMLPLTKGALFVSTAPRTIRAFLDGLPMGRGDRLSDLGCGYRRVLRASAKRMGFSVIIFPTKWNKRFGNSINYLD